MVLNEKQKVFCRHFVDCLNGAEAARRAGYSVRSAAVQGSTLRAMPEIKAEIERLMEERPRFGEGKIIALLERQAEASVSMFLKPGTLEVDPDKVHENGDLIQRLWVTAEGPRIILHDAQAALKLLGQARGLFVERTLLEDLEGIETMDDDAKAPGRKAPRAPRKTKRD